MKIDDLVKQAIVFRFSEKIRVHPATKDEDGEIIVKEGLSKPILGIRPWKGEIVIFYEEEEDG